MPAGSSRVVFDKLARVVLRCSSRAFRQTWSAEAVATSAEVLGAVQRNRGHVAGFLYSVAELFDLTKAAWRSRFGPPLPITSDQSPRQPRLRNSTTRAFLQDVWNGWRRLVREPRAAAGSVLLLALAIGVSSAMFAVIDAFIARPAPFRDPSLLAQPTIRGEDGSFQNLSYPIARAWRDSGIFDDFTVALLNAEGTFDRPTGPVSRGGAYVLPGAFAMLGVSPMLGREFEPGEGRAGNDAQVLLSESVWRDLFEADPAIVGSSIEVAKRQLTVVGVMPASLRFPIKGDGIWRPFDLDVPAEAVSRRRPMVYVRRQASMPVAEAERLAADAVASELKEPGRIEFRDASAGLLDDYSRESLIALAVGVGLVFVVLCANVTNLILARTSVRRQEFGVCTALGASRGRLLRQVFLENAVIGLCATVLGLGLAAVLVALAQQVLPADLLWRTLNPLDLDVRAVAATSLAGVTAVLLAGLPAAWFGTRADANASIGLASRGGTDTPGSRRLIRGLLVVEVAMAVSLLAAAGLQVRSFLNLVNADRGMDSEHVLLASIRLPGTITDKASQAATAMLLEDRVRALPGVRQVTLASNVPPDHGNIHFGFDIQPLIDGAAPVRMGMMRSYAVAPAFFDTFGIHLREGRGFNATDDANAAVLSETLARAIFGDRTALGNSFTLGKETYHVVGVATEIRNSVIDPREDYPEFYQPWYRAGAPGAAASVPGSSSVTLGLRCPGTCPSNDTVRQAVESVSAAVTLTDLHPLSNDFLKQLSRPRAAAIVAAVFSGLAVFATAAGLYGVLAYLVSRRRREFGIRAALGAVPSTLRRSVLADGMKVTGVGVVAGVAAGWALSRWLSSVQFGVTFFDPATWVAVVAGVLAVTVVACWRPATSAMRVDPSEMLRES